MKTNKQKEKMFMSNAGQISTNEVEGNLTKKDFYLGLDDITMYRGKKDAMEKYGKPCRVFTEKFYSSAKRAAELVFLNQVYSGNANKRSATYDPEVLADFWKNVHYDPKQKTYVYEEYFTLGTYQHPKKCQLEHFYKGEYEFIKIRHEIQVLKTELVKAV